jgi:hypothetical protein
MFHGQLFAQRSRWARVNVVIPPNVSANLDARWRYGPRWGHW